jgi:hypothetical protein
MKYGAPIYRQCSHCHKAIEILPLIEGSHSGSVLWTDGYVDAMMMPEQAIVARCNNCDQAQWLTDLDPLEEPDEETVTGYQEIDAEGYLDLAENSQSLDKERMVMLRTWAWQKFNHPRRGKREAPPLTDRGRNNILTLDALLSTEWENELLMKIELARELGLFDQAEQLMEEVDFSPQILHLIRQLKRMIENRDSAVRAYKTRGLSETSTTPDTDIPFR